MNFLKKYYKNTTTYQCKECKYIFTLTPWQWLTRLMKVDFARYSYIKCPRCGKVHWLKGEKVVK